MATSVGVGSSRQADSFGAGREAAQKAVDSVGSQPDVLLVFASTCYEQETLLKGIVSVSPSALLVGCSSAGEILSSGPSRRSIAIMAIKSDSMRAASGLGISLTKNPRQAGREAATQSIQAKLANPHGFFVFPDGLTGNVAEMLRGVQDVLGLSFPVVGACAGDDFGFTKTYQYFQGQVHTDSVPGLLLTGPIAVGVGARHGWRPLGKPRHVTRAFANVVQELDGLSAVNLYEEYFGKAAASLKSESLADMSILYPLGMTVPSEEEFLLRNVLDSDVDGNLRYAGEIPEGSEVRLMMGSKAKALEAARKAAELASMAIAPRSPSFAFVFSSCSRSRLFGRRAAEEVNVIQRTLGENVPLIGFYDYGEQAPLSGFRGLSYFLNESVVVAAVAAP
jgi:hypothetical protein